MPSYPWAKESEEEMSWHPKTNERVLVPRIVYVPGVTGTKCYVDQDGFIGSWLTDVKLEDGSEELVKVDSLVEIRPEDSEKVVPRAVGNILLILASLTPKQAEEALRQISDEWCLRCYDKLCGGYCGKDD